MAECIRPIRLMSPLGKWSADTHVLPPKPALNFTYSMDTFLYQLKEKEIQKFRSDHLNSIKHRSAASHNKHFPKYIKLKIKEFHPP